MQEVVSSPGNLDGSEFSTILTVRSVASRAVCQGPRASRPGVVMAVAPRPLLRGYCNTLNQLGKGIGEAIFAGYKRPAPFLGR